MLSQMVLLLLLAIYLGQRKNSNKQQAIEIIKELLCLPEILEKTLPTLREKAQFFAYKYAFAKSFFHLGRGTAFSLALEGALKLKRTFLYSCRRLCNRRNETWTYCIK